MVRMSQRQTHRVNTSQLNNRGITIMAVFDSRSRAEKAAAQPSSTLASSATLVPSDPPPARWELMDRATAVRKQLLGAGFLPLPAIGKVVLLLGWSDIAATDKIIDRWARDHEDTLSTGIRT